MPDIDQAVAVHKLNVNPDARSVLQKKRNHGEVRNQAAAAEVKLMDACFVRKTSFVTEQGLYCYKVMSFGLKNAPATFQRLINTVFSKQLCRNIEAYIDDMIVKSKERMTHLADLRETFETIRAYNIRLNPKKCVFGVTSRKFLGFLIDERGIEANPDKIQAVIDISSPKTVKEVQRLTCCLTALGIFLSRVGDKCHYFFRAIRKKSKFEWSDEAEAAFLKLKDHLHTLPHLAIKGKAFADFIVEMTRPVFSENTKTKWTVYVDGSSTQNGCGAGIICQSPKGDTYEYAMRFNFQASNNEAEYEALLCGIKMCKAARAEEILALSDSQLISIVFDNGPQFETPKIKDWLAELGIAGHFASVGRPQANGQVEAFNKTISEGK
ncbi:uncharacterized protein [Spinacia oleracea]|uniref:Uncharacterized protein n=1 Tax=Spinacia oleracea TaxID=3562 RepID=A0ABM3QZX1_SPIOL|nr:uncharacterized protein LOC130463732 [Spinacia oleracea]